MAWPWQVAQQQREEASAASALLEAENRQLKRSLADKEAREPGRPDPHRRKERSPERRQWEADGRG